MGGNDQFGLCGLNWLDICRGPLYIVAVSYNLNYMHKVLVNRLVKFVQEKMWFVNRIDMTIAVDWDVKPQTKPNDDIFPNEMARIILVVPHQEIQYQRLYTPLPYATNTFVESQWLTSEWNGKLNSSCVKPGYTMSTQSVCHI